MTDDMEDLNQTYPRAGNFTFGETEAENERMLALVRSGVKTANYAPLADFDDDPHSKPQPGRADIAMNWDGTPALIIRTRAVRKVRVGDVTAAQIAAMGDDASPSLWQKNTGLSPDTLLLIEEFELVEDLSTR